VLQGGIYTRKGGIYARKGRGISMKNVYCFNYHKNKIPEMRNEGVIFEDDNFIITKRNRTNLLSVYHIFADSTTTDFYWDMEDLPKYVKGKIAKELI